MNKEMAKEIARVECEKRDWPWFEPIKVFWGLRCYTLKTNANAKGGNVYVCVRKRDGSVKSASIVPY
jgi:hypothetical protein